MLEDHTKTAARKADGGKISENYPSTGGPMVENDDIYGKIDHSEDEEKEIKVIPINECTVNCCFSMPSFPFVAIIFIVLG